MCYPSPQPRCSGHTGAKIVSLNEKMSKVELEMSKCNAEISRTLDEKEGGPKAIARKQKRLERLTETNNRNYQRYVKYQEELKLTQHDYDGTPRGQKELKAIIDNPKTTPEERKNANRRMKTGAGIRAWRMNQKKRNDGSTTQYKSKRDEKNQKIFLNDPDTIKMIKEASKKRQLVA